MKLYGKEFKFNNNNVYHTGFKPSVSDIGAAPSNHTHNYAVSSQNCSNRDFNTIKTTGYYYGYTGMANAAIQNISVLQVIVYSNDWIVQRQTVINDKGQTYERQFYAGNTWSPWKLCYDSNNQSIQDGESLQMGKYIYNVEDIGISGNHWGGSVSIGAPNVWLKSNNYFDGSDRFMNEKSVACQLYLSYGAAAGPLIRWSVNNPSKDGVIEWSPDYRVLTTKGDFTMNGSIWMDTYGGEKHIKANHDFGMFFNSDGLGWYDWSKGKNVFAYEQSADRVVTYRFFRAAGGMQYSLNQSTFTTEVTTKQLINPLAINNKEYNINNYEVINSNNGKFILNKASDIKNIINESEDSNIISTSIEDFYITLLQEIKTLKTKVEQLEGGNK